MPLVTAAATALPASLQKLTMDLTAVLGVLQSRQPRLQQSLQQAEHSAGSSRLHDLYWQAMKFLGVQYASGRAGAGKTPMLHALLFSHHKFPYSAHFPLGAPSQRRIPRRPLRPHSRAPLA